jgi:hypothetical protein
MSPRLEWVIRKCLAKDPDERWQSAADIIHVLDLVGAEMGAAPAASPETATEPHAKSTHFWPRGAAAFALGGVLVFGGMRLLRPKATETWSYRPLPFSGRAFRPALSPDG